MAGPDKEDENVENDQKMLDWEIDKNLRVVSTKLAKLTRRLEGRPQ